MFKNSCLVATAFALLLGSASAFGQTAANKAESAIGSYAVIISISKTCNFEVSQPVKSAVETNIKALQVVSTYTDAQVGAAIQGANEKVAEKKDGICAMGQEKFNGFMAGQANEAATAGAAAGVTMVPVPANSVAATPAPATPAPSAVDPKKEAVDMLASSHLVELVADECEIELSDDETSKLEKAQAYYRGKADVTEDQVAAMTDAMEKEVTKNRKVFCAKEFGFKAELKKVLLGVK